MGKAFYIDTMNLKLAQDTAKRLKLFWEYVEIWNFGEEGYRISYWSDNKDRMK
jgi:hypothetical protein